MSQRHFNYGPYHVLTGWDRPLQYLFLVVEKGDDDENVVFSNLELDNPAMTEQEIVAKLGELGILMPATLLADLRRDRERDAGNEVTEYPAFDQSGGAHA